MKAFKLVLSSLYTIFLFLFDLVMVPFSFLPPMAGLLFWSAITGIIMLLVYKKFSDQKKIRQVKDRIKAHFLEVMLFRDDLRVILRSQLKILRLNLTYIRLNLVPLVIMIIPIVFIMIQLNAWYGYRGLFPGEKTLLKVIVPPAMVDKIEILKSEGISADSHLLRIKERGEICVRIKPEKEGLLRLVFGDGDSFLDDIKINARKKLSRISPIKSTCFWENLLFPQKTLLPYSQFSKRIEVFYPPRRIEILGIKFHWVIIYFVLSIIFGFGLKGVFNVEI